MKKPEGIDIIIPVYNALEDLQRCAASIFSCTNLLSNRLILVDDASPDERVLPYLHSLEQQNVLVVENKQNLGFSGSINRGIEVSQNRDVILLNSDTIVTKNWVEKMAACAYSDISIATVTPLSNNATLCSVPEFLKENTLPEGYTLEHYAELIEEVSLQAYPRIPVANGFCMYIKREVFEKIGTFDAKTFGRGYGEENDFCYRAEQAGYHHVMCDDTYIYHTGTASFVSEEKRKYIEAHERILNERYPEQNRAVAIHCRDNPNERIQENIRLWTGLKNGRKNILYLVQSDFREDADDHLGGTQLHVRDLMTCMRGMYNVFVAARNLDYLNVTAYTEKEQYSFKYYIGKPAQYPEFRSRKFAKLYGQLLDSFHIHLVHIHHTKDMTLEMFYEAHERNLPIVATLHDYYTLCPSIKMLNCCGKLCIGNPEEIVCKECQKEKFGITEGFDYLTIWRKEFRKVLSFADALITPSESAKAIILNEYPELSDRFHVIEHGVTQMECIHKAEAKNLHVAFLGGLSREKGSIASFQLVKNGPPDITWHLFGVWGYNELSMLEKKNYIKTGLYERDELPGLMEKYQIDLVCILPIWPETYCYTLSEAIMCGVPAIVADIGALGERMRKLNCGWLVSADHTYEETLEIIERIKDKGNEYQEKLKVTRNILLKSLDKMGEEYCELYSKTMLKKLDIARFFFKRKDLKRWCLSGFLFNGNKIMISENDIQERSEALEMEIREIKSSFEYKLAKKLIKFPFFQRNLKAVYSLYIKVAKK